jgi:hypothetical protein
MVQKGLITPGNDIFYISSLFPACEIKGNILIDELKYWFF